ncbi:MAG: methyltransferase domain-containing protein [Planctomycetaceae bacterium]
MTTDYDGIAEQYQRAKLQPWREFIEAFTLMELVGDPAETSVLDVACGEGFYTRMLRARGARRVTGVDISEGMIDLARGQEARDRLGIEYLVGDARNLSLADECDLVFAAYLLNYARDRSELRAMCAGIARCLRPGGRFVTVNCSPFLNFPAAPSFRKYGFETAPAGEWREGTPITWTFHLDDGPFSIENYHLDGAIHEEALRSAGFREIDWRPPRLAPEAANHAPAEFWSSFLENSPVAFAVCVK